MEGKALRSVQRFLDFLFSILRFVLFCERIIRHEISIAIHFMAYKVLPLLTNVAAGARQQYSRNT